MTRTGSLTLQKKYTQVYSVRAIKDSAELENVVPTNLAFDIIPRLSVRSHRLPDYWMRVIAMKMLPTKLQSKFLKHGLLYHYLPQSSQQQTVT